MTTRYADMEKEAPACWTCALPGRAKYFCGGPDHPLIMWAAEIPCPMCAASRAPGPKKWPTALSDEDVERISIDTVLTMGNPESRMALAHAMIRAGFRAALIRESRSGIAKAMTAHDAAEAAPGADRG